MAGLVWIAQPVYNYLRIRESLSAARLWLTPDPCDQPDYQTRAMGTHWTPPPPSSTSPPTTTPIIYVYVVRLRFYTFMDLPPSLPLPRGDLETRNNESSYRRLWRTTRGAAS